MAKRRSKRSKKKPAEAAPSNPGAGVSPVGRPSTAGGAATKKATEPKGQPGESSSRIGEDASATEGPRGWSAFFIAVFAGVLLGLSQPLVTPWTGQDPVLPGESGLLAFVGFVPLFVLVREAKPGRAYWLAFTTVFVQMWIILYWIIIAMTVFGRIPALLSMVALSALAAAIAFGVAAPFAVAHVICRHFRLPYWVMAPVAVTGLELIRNNGPFGGFPWGNVGNSLATVPLFLQGASLFGVYGLVFCIVLVNAALAECWVAFRKGALRFDLPARVACATVILLVGWGAFRLATAPDATAPTVKVALLQPNIEKGIKNEEYQNRRQILERFHTLQQAALEEGAEIVVWPEASLPTNVRTTSKSLKNKDVIKRQRRTRSVRRRGKKDRPAIEKKQEPPPLVPPAGIIGGTASFPVVGPDGKKTYKHYNSAFATTKDLKIVGRFDKAHLVPFGEYIPWPLTGIVSHFVAITSEAGDGLHPVALDVNGRTIKVAATICYEGAFPEISRALANEGAELMFNVTNDSWYGISSMAHQHMALYALRAVENNRAVARVANTGISGWVDSRGRIYDATPMYETTKVVADVPVVSGTTVYRLLGEWIAYPCMLLSLLLWFWAISRPGTRPRKAIEQAIAGICALAIAVALLPLYGEHESIMTMRTVVVIGALLVGLGAWSGRRWGRRAQMIVGVVAVVLVAPFVVGGEPGALPFALFFAACGIVARYRTGEYSAASPVEDGL